MNEIKIGDIIEVKSKIVRRSVKNIGLLYLKPNSLEFCTQYASEVLMYLSAFLRIADNPKGRVTAYGARTEEVNTHCLIANVRNRFGKAEMVVFTEDEVNVVDKKKGKKRS